MIIGYPLIAALETLKEWKVVITSVRQEYESIKGWYSYKTRKEITYRGWGLLMEIGKLNENFKNEKPKCFNYEIYRHIARDCKKPKKEKDTRKCYKCGRIGYIAKDYRIK